MEVNMKLIKKLLCRLITTFVLFPIIVLSAIPYKLAYSFSDISVIDFKATSGDNCDCCGSCGDCGGCRSSD